MSRDCAMTAFAICVLLAQPISVHAHGGGLDANRCHTEKKTGLYQCAGRWRQAVRLQ